MGSLVTILEILKRLFIVFLLKLVTTYFCKSLNFKFSLWFFQILKCSKFYYFLTCAGISSIAVRVSWSCSPLYLVIKENNIRFRGPPGQHGLERVPQCQPWTRIGLWFCVDERQVKHGHDEGPLESRLLTGKSFLQDGVNFCEGGGIDGLAVRDIPTVLRVCIGPKRRNNGDWGLVTIRDKLTDSCGNKCEMEN